MKTKRCLCGRTSAMQRVVAMITLFSGLSVLFIHITNTTNETKIVKETSINGRAINGRPINGRPIKVLLFSYYRSGSSLLGSLFDLNPSAFYWVEPFAATTIRWGWMYDRIPPRNFYHYDNGTEKFIPAGDLREKFLTPIHSIYNCSFSTLPNLFFPVKLNWNEMSKMGRHHLCVKHLVRPRECAPRLTNHCRRSEIIAVKTKRLRMKHLGDLFEADPDIRLVYMTRDPRGMLNSWWTHTRISRRYYSDGDKATDARVMCLRILTDWKEFVDLRNKHPRNCLWVGYEDLARFPEAETGRVYEFLGLSEVPRTVVAGMREITSANSSNGHFGVRRRNSTVTASRWMNTMRSELQTMVKENCFELLKELHLNLN